MFKLFKFIKRLFGSEEFDARTRDELAKYVKERQNQGSDLARGDLEIEYYETSTHRQLASIRYIRAQIMVKLSHKLNVFIGSLWLGVFLIFGGVLGKILQKRTK